MSQSRLDAEGTYSGVEEARVGQRADDEERREDEKDTRGSG